MAVCLPASPPTPSQLSRRTTVILNQPGPRIYSSGLCSSKGFSATWPPPPRPPGPTSLLAHPSPLAGPSTALLEVPRRLQTFLCSETSRSLSRALPSSPLWLLLEPSELQGEGSRGGPTRKGSRGVCCRRSTHLILCRIPRRGASYGDSPWTQVGCSIAQSCLTLCDPLDCSTLGLPVHHQLPEFTQTHVH